MIDKRDLPQRKSRFHAGLTAARWSAAALIVAGAHAGAVWAALNWREVESAPSEPPPAVMIDLAPVAVAPSAPPQDVAPGPQQTEAELQPIPDAPTPIDEPKPDPTPPVPTQEVENLPPDPTPPDAPPVPNPAPPAPPIDMKIPDLPKNEQADAILTPPPPPPPEPKAQKKPPAKPREAEERKKPVRLDKKRVLQTTAPPVAEARLSTAAAAPAAGAAFQVSVSPASWKGDLVAHLNRYKRYPPGALSYGTASIAFSISRSGQVLSSRLIGSSGDHALDEEAVSLPRRASPVPPPPPDVGGATITLTVPIRFNR